MERRQLAEGQRAAHGDGAVEAGRSLNDPEADVPDSALTVLECERFTGRDMLERMLDDPDERVRCNARNILERLD